MAMKKTVKTMIITHNSDFLSDPKRNPPLTESLPGTRIEFKYTDGGD